jgi:hypothetical protein
VARTRVKRRTLSPEWGEIFIFDTAASIASATASASSSFPSSSHAVKFATLEVGDLLLLLLLLLLMVVVMVVVIRLDTPRYCFRSGPFLCAARAAASAAGATRGTYVRIPSRLSTSTHIYIHTQPHHNRFSTRGH